METLKPQSTHLILYVRRQDRLLESLYMERIHRGRTLPWEEFRERVCADDRVRFTDLIDEVTAAPTVESIRIRPFEIIGAGAPAFIADFLDGIDMRHLYDHLPPRVLATTNPSYTEPAWKAALALNHLLDTTEQTTRLRRFLRELFPSDHYPPAPLLTDQQRADLIDTYRDENQRLFTTHLPDLPPDTYTTTNATNHLRTHLTPIEPPTGRAPLSERLRSGAREARRALR